MKILFIAPNYLPHIGGVEKHIYYLSKELEKDGHNITILVPKFDNNYKSYENDNTIKIVRLNKLKNRYFNRLRNLFYLIRNMNNLLNFDIVHFHDFMTFYNFGILIFPILRLFNKKIYITFHGWEGDIPPKKNIILKRKIVEKLVDGNICIGHFIEKWYGTKADIISYGGVEKKDISDIKEEYILFVGRLAKDTGIFDYIKAWEIISKNSNLKFVICGDGVLREKIERYIQKHKIKRVIFKGFVTDVNSYIKDAKLIFTAGYLGILEAFSYKKNVIAIYDNELKKDYLKMIPNYDKMMWIVDNKIDNIIREFNEAIVDNEKKEIAYKYSLNNSWEKVKKDYYKLWRI